MGLAFEPSTAAAAGDDAQRARSVGRSARLPPKTEGGKQQRAGTAPSTVCGREPKVRVPRSASGSKRCALASYSYKRRSWDRTYSIFYKAGVNRAQHVPCVVRTHLAAAGPGAQFDWGLPGPTQTSASYQHLFEGPMMATEEISIQVRRSNISQSIERVHCTIERMTCVLFKRVRRPTIEKGPLPCERRKCRRSIYADPDARSLSRTRTGPGASVRRSRVDEPRINGLHAVRKRATGRAPRCGRMGSRRGGGPLASYFEKTLAPLTYGTVAGRPWLSFRVTARLS